MAYQFFFPQCSVTGDQDTSLLNMIIADKNMIPQNILSIFGADFVRNCRFSSDSGRLPFVNPQISVKEMYKGKLCVKQRTVSRLTFLSGRHICKTGDQGMLPSHATISWATSHFPSSPKPASHSVTRMCCINYHLLSLQVTHSSGTFRYPV